MKISTVGPSELRDHARAMFADLDGLRARWLPLAKSTVSHVLGGQEAVNRLFSEDIIVQPIPEQLRPWFPFQQLTGLTAEIMLMNWQHSVLIATALNNNYIEQHELQSMINAFMAESTGRWDGVFGTMMAEEEPLTIAMISRMLAHYLMNEPEVNEVTMKVMIVLRDYLLPFLGNLIHMKTAIVFDDFELANDIAKARDPSRRW